MARVELQQVARRYGNVVAIEDITFTVPDGEFWVLVGPSGCGKSTILRAIAGLDLWRAGNPPQPIAPHQVQELIDHAEWADVEATRSELYLLLCWGNPKESYYAWAYPESGCDRVIAAQGWPSGIKV